MRQLVQQYASRFKKNLRRVIVGKRTLDVSCAIEDVHESIPTTLGRDSLIVANNIVQTLTSGDAVRWFEIQRAHHGGRYLTDVRIRIGYDGMINTRSLATFVLIFKIYSAQMGIPLVVCITGHACHFL